MNNAPINKMLVIIVERKPDVVDSECYKSIIESMAKGKDNLTYAEKRYVRDNLRALCMYAGLSYERLIMKVCK